MSAATENRAPAAEPDDARFLIRWTVKATDVYVKVFTAQDLGAELGLPAGTRLGDLDEHGGELDVVLADAEEHLNSDLIQLERDITRIRRLGNAA